MEDFFVSLRQPPALSNQDRIIKLNKNWWMDYSQFTVSAFLYWHMTKLTHRERPYLLRSSSASDRGGAGSSEEGGAELRDRRIAQG